MPCPNMGAENYNFLKLLKTMIVGLFGFVQGLPEHYDTLFFWNRIKMTELWPLRWGLKMPVVK